MLYYVVCTAILSTIGFVFYFKVVAKEVERTTSVLLGSIDLSLEVCLCLREETFFRSTSLFCSSALRSLSLIISCR